MAENRELALVLRLVADQFQSGMSTARKSLEDFGKGMAQMAAPLAAVGVAMGGVVIKAANFGDQLAKTSQRIGVSVEELSTLQYAAQLADVSNEQLSTGLGKLAKNLFDASNGTGEAQKAFETLGISVTDSHGEVKSAGSVVEEVAAKFAGMKDSTEKTALAMQIFGKSGKDLIPLLNAGQEGLRASAREAERLGVVLSTTDAKAAEEFNDNLTRLGKLFEGMIVQLGTQFIPVLNSLAEAVKPVVFAISDWAKAHPDLMQGLVAMAGILGAGGAVAVAVAAFGVMLAGLAAVGGPIMLVAAGIAATVGTFVAFRKELTAAIESLKRFINDGLSAADRFISTMAEGLERKIAPIAKVAESIATAVARFLKPGSPTEDGPWSDLDQWGERFGETLADGMARSAPVVAEAAEDLAADAKKKFASPADRRVANELDLRGTVPVREGGRFQGAVERTGTTFTDGMAESFAKFSERARDNFALGVQFADAAAQAMARGFEQFFFNVMAGKIRSLKDVFRAMQDLTKTFVSAIIQELARIAAVKFVGLWFGGVNAPAAKAHAGGQLVRRFGLGGPVPGTGNLDTVPAMLTPGEFVLSRKDVGDIKRGLIGGASSPVNVTVNVVNSGQSEKPQVNVRRELENTVIDIIFRDVQRNGPLRQLMQGA